jgi:hypothetical protein
VLGGFRNQRKRDMKAAERWRDYRSSKLRRLEAEYASQASDEYFRLCKEAKDRSQPEPAWADLARMEGDARRRAGEDVTQRLGPNL